MIELLTLDKQTISEFGLGCIKNKKHEGFSPKVEWYRENYDRGLRIILLRKTGKVIGFLEYIPGEYAWRPVRAAGYLFIHCICVYQKKEQRQGNGAKLLQHAIETAGITNKNGVAVVASDGSWLADKRLFRQDGFETVAQLDRFDLMIYQIKDSPLPQFIDFRKNCQRISGLQLHYAVQCPMVSKVVDEIADIAKNAGVRLELKKIISADHAQAAPSGYGVFSLVKDGKLLADHYISSTRFKNILKKEYPAISI